MTFLNNESIPCNTYYPIPIHLQKGFSKFEINTDLTLTEDLCSRVISLPMHTEMEEDQISFITKKVLEFFKK